MTQAGEDRKFHLDEAPGITGSRSLGEGEWKLRDPGASACLARPGALDQACGRRGRTRLAAACRAANRRGGARAPRPGLP